MTKALLIYGSTGSADMRHVIPHEVHDPFLFLEIDGVTHTVLKSLEVARMEAVPAMHAHPFEEFGIDAFRAAGSDPATAELETFLAACRALGVERALVPPTFPVELADFLRAGGVELIVDRHEFMMRRRAKTAVELEGMRRAQIAAEAGVSFVADCLDRSTVDTDGGLLLDDVPLTCEYLKEGIIQAFLRNGCDGTDLIVAHGEQTCIGHHSGSGQPKVGEPITIDICPRDIESSTYTDMTRTFVKGEINEELQTYYAIVRESLARVMAAIKPGLPVAELHRISCEPIEAAGFPTQLTKKPGEVLNEGYFHSLGHGVGLEIHEEPSLGQNDDVLVVGDVIAVEPGCYRQGFGGVRLEDIVLVTEDGCELITDYPYELVPVAYPRGV